MRLCIAAALVILAVSGGNAAGLESVRTQEIFECRSGEVMTWGDGRDHAAVSAELRFTYNPQHAPSWFSEEEVRAMVATAAAAWSQCRVPARVVPWRKGRIQEGTIVVQWNEKGSGGNFGLANLTARTLSLGPGAFGMLRSRNPAYDARQTLQMVLSHEMGHLFGLMAHSRRCVDVMSYYNNGKGEVCFSRDPSQLNSVVEYRNTLPTACDIERCRAANGKGPLPGGRLGR